MDKSTKNGREMFAIYTHNIPIPVHCNVDDKLSDPEGIGLGLGFSGGWHHCFACTELLRVLKATDAQCS